MITDKKEMRAESSKIHTHALTKTNVEKTWSRVQPIALLTLALVLLYLGTSKDVTQGLFAMGGTAALIIAWSLK